MSARPLLHIGYHKTGTTWLQRSVFSNPATGFWLAAGVDKLLPAVVRPGPFAFDAEAARSALSGGIEDAQGRGLVPVLSFERLSGDPHRGGRDSGILAERLREAFPDARILVLFREQRSMILSLYKTYIRLGGPATLGEYLRARPGPHFPALFDFGHLEYHLLVARYRDLFGAGNVLALPYEVLGDGPLRFVNRVAEFAGAGVRGWPRVRPMNVSPSALGLSVKRLVNKWCVESNRNPSPVLPLRVPDWRLRVLVSRADRRLPERWRGRWDARWEALVEEAVGRRYAESNAATAKLTGLDLRRYGYSL